MPREVDHYKVLGVPRDADMDAVKLAYRKAALDCHPDNYSGDPDEAEQKLRELIVAYKCIARELDPSSWSTAAPVGRTFTPQDFAREGSAAVWQPTLDSDRKDRGVGTPSIRLSREHGEATRNETRIFVSFWVLAIVLGILVGGAAACYRAYTLGSDSLTFTDIVVSVLVGELIYAGLAVGTFILIVLTRKVVRLTLRLAQMGWRFLPGRAPGRELPRSSSGRELPADSSPEETP